VKQVEWTEFALEDMAGLDKGMARRVKRAVERFAQTGAGNVKKLQGIDPPSIASVPAITGSASSSMAKRSASSASETARRLIAKTSDQ
jgi:hypothetical protein